MNDFFINPEIIEERKGALSALTLNRPGKLNALNMDMIRLIASELKRVEQDDAVKAIVFKGAGDRAFCAGGDIVSFYHGGMDFRRGKISLDVATLYFAEEYSLNRALFNFDKPTISFINGITMGGGYGVAGNTQYIAACEQTIFAMPETRIGFFIDIGAAYHLNQIPSKALGRYLAMTGENLYGRDVFDAGLANLFISPDDYAAVEDALAKGNEAAEDILKSFHKVTGNSQFLADNLEWVERVFTHKDVGAILDALKESPEAKAKETLDILYSRSPISVRVCLEYFNRADSMSFDEVINFDYALARYFAQGRDFYEGIRAALIDRDKKPQWEPESLELVEESTLMNYFNLEKNALDEFEKTA